jgi:predicted RNA binding protein YcfA (HicA-like mRNA interferase family)
MDREQFRRRISQHPRSVRFEELAELLRAYGFEVVRIRSSHHIFQRGGLTVSIPLHRPHLKPVYVQQVLSLLGSDDDDDDNSG